MSAKPTADGTEQKRLNFDVPVPLAREFKAYAALQGRSQRDLVLAFITRCVRRMPTDNEQQTDSEQPQGHPATPRDQQPKAQPKAPPSAEPLGQGENRQV